MADEVVSRYNNDSYPTSVTWMSLKFRPGRLAQSAEQNEVQDILQEYQGRLGNTIFDAGDRLDGCELVIENSAPNVAIVTDGRMWLNDRVLIMEGTVSPHLTIDGVGTEYVGVVFTESTTDYTTDATLRDPNAGYPGYDSPGADRIVYSTTWYSRPRRSVTGNTTEPFNIVSGQNDTMVIVVDKGVPQTITLTNGTRTATQIAADINSGTTGCTASVVGGAVKITSDLVTSDAALDLNEATDSAYSTLGLDWAQLFIPVHELYNGSLKLYLPSTQYSDLERRLATQWYDTLGNYVIKNFPVQVTSASDPNKLTAKVSSGKAVVRGFSVETLATQSVTFDRSRSFTAVSSEDRFYQRDTYSVLELNENYVRNASQVSGILPENDSRPKSASPVLLSSGVRPSGILQVNAGGTWDAKKGRYTGGTDYVEGTSFKQTDATGVPTGIGNYIVWGLGGPEPAGSFYAVWTRSYDFTKGYRVLKSVSGESVTRSSAGLSAPTGLSGSVIGTTGTTRYAYQVTASKGGGETVPTEAELVTTGHATMDDDNYVELTWNPVVGATGYSVYGRTGTNGDSLLLNGNMEAGSPPSSWTASSATLAQDTSPHAGTYCLKATDSGAGAGFAYQDLSVTAGDLMYVSAWAKATGGDTARVEVYDQTGGASVYIEDVTATSWTEVEAIFKVPAGCTTLRIKLIAQGAGDIVWFDDISSGLTSLHWLVEVPSAQTWWSDHAAISEGGSAPPLADTTINYDALANGLVDQITALSGYTAGTDYSLYDGQKDFEFVAGHIYWIPGGSAPSGGSSYNVSYDYWAAEQRATLLGSVTEDEDPLGIGTVGFNFTSSNNKMLIEIDNSGLDVTVTFTAGTGYSAVQVCDMINATSGLSGVASPNDEGKVKLSSPTTGGSSQIDIKVIGNDAYTQLGLTAGTTVTGSSSTEGDYLAADSYDDYDEVPTYVPASGIEIELRDCIDFRCAGLKPWTDYETSQSQFDVDYNYYESNMSSLYLDELGTFRVQTGTEGYTGLPPSVPEQYLMFAWLDIPAYTYSPSSVTVHPVEIKNFRMKDIWALEHRLDYLEYYSTIDQLTTSLLATQTGTDVKVGGFTDTGTGVRNVDINFKDRTCRIVTEDTPSDTFLMSHTMGFDPDPLEQCFQLPFSMDIETIDVDSGTTTLRLEDTRGGRSETVEAITLPFQEEAFIEQLLCSESLNVNPYDVFTWTGDMELDPPSSVQMDTTRAPDLNVSFEGERDSWADEGLAWSTEWDAWSTVWSGTDVTTANIEHDPEFGGGEIGRTEVTSTTTTSLSRTGVKRSLFPNAVVNSIGDKVVDSSLSIYMLDEDINVIAKGMKPNQTNLTVEFEGVAIPISDHPDDTGSVYASGGNGSIVTDATGTTMFQMNIPAATFRTGRRKVSLYNDETNALSWFEVQGLTQTVQETFLTVDTLQSRSEVINDSRVVTSTNTNITATWADPLAESFRTGDSPVYVSRIDLFFKTKDSNVPITLQVRAMAAGGQPSMSIIQTTTVAAADVNVSTDGSVATPFYFKDPVQLQTNTSFSFVVLANSTSYECWAARIGATDLATGKKIVKQPYTGVLFKSQNSETWTADQEADLKFVVYTANFEEEGQIVWDNLTGVQAGLLALNVTSVLPSDCKVDWYYSTDGGSSYSGFIPFKNTPLNAVATQVKLKANVKAAGLTPIISRSRGAIILVTYLTSGDYVGYVNDLGSETIDSLKYYVEENIPSGSTDLEAYFSLDAEGASVVNWIPFDLTKSVVIDSEWSDKYYEQDTDQLAHDLVGTISNSPRRSSTYAIKTGSTPTIEAYDGATWNNLGTVSQVSTNADFTNPATMVAGEVEWSYATHELNFSDTDISTYGGNNVRVSYEFDSLPTKFRIWVHATTTNQATSPKFRKIRALGTRV